VVRVVRGSARRVNASSGQRRARSDPPYQVSEFRVIPCGPW